MNAIQTFTDRDEIQALLEGLKSRSSPQPYLRVEMSVGKKHETWDCVQLVPEQTDMWPDFIQAIFTSEAWNYGYRMLFWHKIAEFDPITDIHSITVLG